MGKPSDTAAADVDIADQTVYNCSYDGQLPNRQGVLHIQHGLDKVHLDLRRVEPPVTGRIAAISGGASTR
jgi:hypothetical protein